MDFQCKFVILSNEAERVLFEVVKQNILDDFVYDVGGIDRIEFEQRHYNTEYTGLVRVPVVVNFHTMTCEEASTLYDVYTWVTGMIRRYGQDFGVDEVKVDGTPVPILDAYRVPQMNELRVI
jgi:hypothetical protein